MIHIKLAQIYDMKETLDIYRYYVENTAITFEYQTPSLEEFQQRYLDITKKFPYLIAIENNQIVGYAYAHTFNPRDAYDWSVETSIYVRHGHQKKGIGKKLYQALENILSEQGVLNLNACIAYPIIEDTYLNKNSVEYHRHLGYQWVGEFHHSGYKFQTWYNMVWMEKIIGEHLDIQPPILSFSQVKETIAQKYNIN